MGKTIMAAITDLYKHIRRLDDPSVDCAMAAALPTSDEKSTQLLSLMLLERRHPAGLLAMVQQYHRLSPAVRQQVTDRVAELYRPLREAAAGRDNQSRANVIAIIRRCRDARLAYLIVQLLRGRDGIDEAAADCLLDLAAWVCTDSLDGKSDAKPHAESQVAFYFQRAIEDSLDSFAAHQNPAALLALAMIAPRPLVKAHKALNDLRHPAVEPLRRMIEDAREPAMRRALLWFAQVPTLEQAATAGIRKSFEQSLGADCLVLAHLTLDPRVRQAIARLQNAEPWPAAGHVDALTPRQSRNLPRWISALPLTCTQKVQRLAALRDAADAPSRLSALRHLMALRHDPNAVGVEGQVAEFTHDADPQIARIALRFLVAVEFEELPGLLLKLVNAPHPEIRALAAEELAPLGFERLWSAWPNMTDARRIAAARALIKIDPNFHRQLGVRLAKPEQRPRLRALSIIHLLSQGSFFTEALETLAKDTDPTIASAAVRALGTAEGDEAKAALEAALQHADPRVRANAVEALHELNVTGHVDTLRDMAASEQNRPRANAIAALMESDVNTAMAELQQMLADKRSDQRVSALWLVDQMALVDLARHVAEMSISDPDPDVRGRADQVIQRLIESLEGKTGAA